MSCLYWNEDSVILPQIQLYLSYFRCYWTLNRVTHSTSKKQGQIIMLECRILVGQKTKRAAGKHEWKLAAGLWCWYSPGVLSILQPHLCLWDILLWVILLWDILLQLYTSTNSLHKPLTKSFWNTLSKKYVNKYF